MVTERSNVMKELYKLLKKADTLYDGQVEFVLDHGEKMTPKDDNQEDEESEDDKYLNIFFFVTPKGGPYKSARIKFHMRVDVTSYPATAPEINCRNAIYHPNINYSGYDERDADICVNLLDSDWEPTVGLDGAVMAVLFLFYNPQLDDALSPVCMGNEDYDEFEENVRRSLRGEDIDDYVFDKLLIDDSPDADNNGKEGDVSLTSGTAANDTINTPKIIEETKSGAGPINAATAVAAVSEETLKETIQTHLTAGTTEAATGAAATTETSSSSTTTATTTTKTTTTAATTIATTTIIETIATMTAATTLAIIATEPLAAAATTTRTEASSTERAIATTTAITTTAEATSKEALTTTQVTETPATEPAAATTISSTQTAAKACTSQSTTTIFSTSTETRSPQESTITASITIDNTMINNTILVATTSISPIKPNDESAEIELNKKTTNRNTLKFSVFKYWCSKLRCLVSTRFNSFRNRL